MLKIRPKLTPQQVWAKYGFPLASKQISQRIHAVRVNPDTASSIKYMGDGFFSISKKYRYLVKEPYETSDQCCMKLKKEPFHRYEKESGRRPILGIMASESLNRERTYIHNGGCNVFSEKGTERSYPLSIWNEEDIWNYIHRFDVKIADIYTKGLDRTGCFGCAYGANRADDIRFEVLHKEYPKCYDMVMNYTNNGVTYREALRKVLSLNGLYLPDERPKGLFDE